MASRPAVAGRADEIAKQCFALFARQGFDAVSMEDLSAADQVSERAACTTTTPASRTSLPPAWTAHWMHCLRSSTSQARQRYATGTGCLRARPIIADTVRPVRRGHRAGTTARGHPRRAASPEAASFDRALADLITDAQSAGQVRADIDAALLGRLLLGIVIRPPTGSTARARSVPEKPSARSPPRSTSPSARPSTYEVADEPPPAVRRVFQRRDR